MKKCREDVRILLIGDRNVGKTSLILSLVRHNIRTIFISILRVEMAEIFVLMLWILHFHCYVRHNMLSIIRLNLFSRLIYNFFPFVRHNMVSIFYFNFYDWNVRNISSFIENIALYSFVKHNMLSILLFNFNGWNVEIISSLVNVII